MLASGRYSRRGRNPRLTREFILITLERDTLGRSVRTRNPIIGQPMTPLAAYRERERERKREAGGQVLRDGKDNIIIPRELVSFCTVRASSNRRVVSRARARARSDSEKRQAVERAEVETGGRAPLTVPKVDWPCNPH